MAFFKKSKKGARIETLEEAITQIEGLIEELKSAEDRIKNLEEKSNFSFQKFKLVRYNPFEDRGGDQSFSLAMLDKENNGFVISSIFINGDTRIFAKPVEKGKSTYELSEEEKKAIEKAK
jgi:C4-type Zn-finger protein